MSARTFLGLAAVVILGTACSTAATGKGDAALTSASAPLPCSLGVEGAEVVVEDTPQGVALTFTAPPEKADELRTRGRDAANMYGPRKMGEGHDGRHGTGGHHGLAPMQMPPAYAVTENVDNGIQLRLVPVDDHDLTVLRARARERAVAMSKNCH